ncbi:MAG: DUF4215 domain-containing protein [Proteobacteria bacterium]|nr:DUF4215 domain-containing protein [Pseudomonadota bacterium]
MRKRRYLWSLCLLGLLGGYGCAESDSPITVPSDPTASKCGNGNLDENEACDDGNIIAGDGCASNCAYVEAGYQCFVPGFPCTKVQEPVIPNPPVTSKCKNGIVEEGEQCDDNNPFHDEGCTANCRIEEGWECPPAGGKCIQVKPPVTARCGDQNVDEILGEECDFDFDMLNGPVGGDGCSATCKIEPGYICQAGTCFPAGCGNGVVEDGEDCEPIGNGVDYSTLKGDPLECGSNCHYAPYCGDGITQEAAGEACDNGAQNQTSRMNAYGKDACMTDCTRGDYCGDKVFTRSAYIKGVMTVVEECEPVLLDANGRDIINEGCSNDCRKMDGYHCDARNGICEKDSDDPIVEPPKPYVAECNNGILDVTEECDDTSNPGCSNKCKTVDGYKCQNSPRKCTKDCVNTECAKIKYGDGKIDEDGYEQCDDGNTKNGDGCSSKGVIEAGYVCPTPGEPCVAAACGDGIRAYGEECDDGNSKDGDGCSSRCRIEFSATCSKNSLGGKSTCKANKCGDGSITGQEQCDNGAQNGKDGKCTADCKLVSRNLGSCGNGTVDYKKGEECDDGNKKGGDGCSPTCQIERAFECYNDGKSDVCRPICGDGITMWMLNADVKEECDDGNMISGDGCSANCTIEKGYECTKFENNPYPETINLPVTYRDFRGRDTSGSASASGYQSSTWINKLKNADATCASRTINKDTDGMPSWLFSQSNYSAGEKYLVAGKGHPDFQGFGRNLCLGMVKDELDYQGKPVFSGDLNASCCGNLSSSECAAKAAAWNTGNGTMKVRIDKDHVKDHVLCGPSFDTWYRTDTDINSEISYNLLLTREDLSSGRYVFDSDNPPANAKGAGGRPFVKGYFSPLDNIGYDDVRSVKVNGSNYSLAGNFTTEVHTYFQYKPKKSGDTSTLNFTGDDDVWVFINNKLFVDLGGMHSKIVGENSLKAQNCSNGQLCDPNYEVYEGGVYDMHVFQAEREYTGSNFKLTLTGFINSGASYCASNCGDKEVAASEECDEGAGEKANFKGCSNTCRRQAYCGNGVIEEGEQCDNGFACQSHASWCQELGTSYNSSMACDNNCKLTKSTCGNNKKEGSEECDGTDTPAGKVCLSTCRIAKCGDGIVTPTAGEECDKGANNGKGGCTTACKKPVCGDGEVDYYSGEVCDDGPNGNDGRYGHCGLNCTYMGPSCGDGVVQTAEGEVCDDGKNDGSYNGCMPGCKKRGPYCGDGVTDKTHGEECDGGTGCTSSCAVIVN